jgi:hypothetical protein
MSDDIDYSERTLAETPAKVAKFIYGITSNTSVWVALASAGMTKEHLDEGRTLLNGALLLPPDERRPGVDAQRKALAEVDAWDEPNFRAYRATLRRHHPLAGSYIFHDLSAATGLKAVTGVQTFLNRVDALDQGNDPNRKDTKPEDRAAVDHLATRGLSKAERARLRALVNTALGEGRDVPAAELEAQHAQAQARATSLLELRSWFDEWSSIAHAHVQKRSHLLSMGLVDRKVGAKDDEDE